MACVVSRAQRSSSCSSEAPTWSSGLKRYECPNSTVCFSDSAGSVANSLISDSACMIRSRASSLRSGARRAFVSLTVGGSI